VKLSDDEIEEAFTKIRDSCTALFYGSVVLWAFSRSSSRNQSVFHRRVQRNDFHRRDARL